MTRQTPFTIRRLATGDIDLVRELLAVLGQAFEDEPAIQLYTKLGIRTDVLHFDIAVR